MQLLLISAACQDGFPFVSVARWAANFPRNWGEQTLPKMKWKPASFRHHTSLDAGSVKTRPGLPLQFFPHSNSLAPQSWPSSGARGSSSWLVALEARWIHEPHAATALLHWVYQVQDSGSACFAGPWRRAHSRYYRGSNRVVALW